jgi:serine/threonine protein kinase
MATYTWEKVIGCGSTAEVFACTQHLDGVDTPVVVKVFDNSECMEELEALRRVGGKPGVIQLLDVIVHKERLCPVLQRMPMNLDKFLQKEKDISASTAQSIAYQMLCALDVCAKEHIVHGDVQTFNTLIDPDTHEIILCDFGNARCLRTDCVCHCIHDDRRAQDDDVVRTMLIMARMLLDPHEWICVDTPDVEERLRTISPEAADLFGLVWREVIGLEGALLHPFFASCRIV